MIVADNGSDWYISGTPDKRWNDDDLDQLKTVPGSAFEAVDIGGEAETPIPSVEAGHGAGELHIAGGFGRIGEGGMLPALDGGIVDFADRAIGRQSRRLNMANGAFVRELSDSRTFCLQSDVDAMRSNGLALGGSYENAVVVEGDRVAAAFAESAPVVGLIEQPLSFRITSTLGFLLPGGLFAA